MRITSLHQVIIYHDETKDVHERNFKGHVLFFVPIALSVKSETPLLGTSLEEYSPQKMLFEKLMQCRQEFSCDGKLHFSEISGQTWTKYDFAYRRATALAVDALRSKKPSAFDRPLCCKVAAIFYPKGAVWDMYGGDSRKEQKLRHDETLLRILLKGACHYLYDDANHVQVLQIISDGNAAHRQLDEERIAWRLTCDDAYGRSALRDYVSFAPGATITHLPSDHKKYPIDSEDYMHANLLQIADLMLGSIMRACYVGIQPRRPLPQIGDHCIKKDIVALPMKEMLDKKQRGAGFKRSGYYKSFTITQVHFSKEDIVFQELQAIQIQDEDASQMSFPI